MLFIVFGRRAPPPQSFSLPLPTPFLLSVLGVSILGLFWQVDVRYRHSSFRCSGFWPVFSGPVFERTLALLRSGD